MSGAKYGGPSLPTGPAHCVDGGGDQPAAGGASCSSDAAPSSSHATRMPKYGLKTNWSREDVMELMPPVVGLSVSIETVWDKRWKVMDPDDPPIDKGAAFGKKRSEREAVLCIARFAWRIFCIDNEGIECPWDFSEISGDSTLVH